MKPTVGDIVVFNSSRQGSKEYGIIEKIYHDEYPPVQHFKKVLVKCFWFGYDINSGNHHSTEIL